jgi:hypothetical protein
MDCRYVFLEIRLLGKGLVAVRFAAAEWFLFCVDSKMVEEVMDLGKGFKASSISAFKYLNGS